MALFGSAATSTASASNTQGDISKDVAVSQPPEDSVSEISFSPQADYLAVASWDRKVRIYEINSSGQSEGRAAFEHSQPVLGCCWSAVSLCGEAPAQRDCARSPILTPLIAGRLKGGIGGRRQDRQGDGPGRRR